MKKIIVCSLIGLFLTACASDTSSNSANQRAMTDSEAAALSGASEIQFKQQ